MRINSASSNIVALQYQILWFHSWVSPSFRCLRIRHVVFHSALTRNVGLTVSRFCYLKAAVVSDPQNQIFVIKNAGFVAYAVEGSYDVLSIVDQTHLPTVIKDHITGATLGWTHEVTMKSKTGDGPKEFVVALLYVVLSLVCIYSSHRYPSLNIPANNCAILQKGDDLELLPAGQHYITNPNVTLRGLYTLGENQKEMPTKDMYTRDQVPVSLTIYLKWYVHAALSCM